MSALLGGVLFGVAVAALGVAGLRAAAALGLGGLQRALAGTALAAVAACAEALLLGLVDLGSSPAALTLAAFATGVLAMALLPDPDRRLSAAASAWWGEAGTGARVALGAGAGALLAATCWYLVRPSFGSDALLYHLAIPFVWIKHGDPGAVVQTADEVPYGNWPLTSELLWAWGSGIARSFVPAVVSVPALLVLLAGGGFSFLRTLGATRTAAWLGVGAIALSPLLIGQLRGPNTDLPAVAWLACCAALAVAARERPGALVAAVAAAGMAGGTKTTVLPLALLALGVGAWQARAGLRRYAAPLAAAVVAAVGVGGLWYLRNLFDHGWPFWPFQSGPGGDTRPPLMTRFDASLLSDPGSARGRWDDYEKILGGGVILLAGIVLAPLLRRDRRVLALALVAAAAALLWSAAPFTAYPPGPFFDALQSGATRYLVPAMAVVAAAMALAASGPGRGSQAAKVLLALAVIWNVWRAAFGFPLTPPGGVLVLGLAAGAGVAFLATRLRLPTAPRGLVPGLAAAVLALAVVAATPGYAERAAEVEPLSTPAWKWLVAQDDYRDGDDPVALQFHMQGLLAGERIDHELIKIPIQPDCAALRALAARAWILLPDPGNPGVAGFGDVTQGLAEGRAKALACLAGAQPAFQDAGSVVYAPGTRVAGSAAP